MRPIDACNAIGRTNFATAPADCASATIGGNGNGSLEENGYAEAAAVWAHLAAAGFIQGSYTGVAANDAAYAATTVAPINAFNGRVMLTRTARYYDAGTASVRLAYIYGNQVPVNILRELDVKVDDSRPQTGVLRSTILAGTEVWLTTAACVNTATQIWDIEANEQNCNAVYLY